MEGWVGVGLELGGLFHDPFYGGRFGVEGWQRHYGKVCYCSIYDGESSTREIRMEE